MAFGLNRRSGAVSSVLAADPRSKLQQANRISEAWFRVMTFTPEKDLANHIRFIAERSHAFDPLDLEIIDLVYEVACEQISAREPSRDMAEDEEWENTLRKSVFALAGDGGVDFDTLLDRVLASLPQPLRQQPTDRDYV